MAKQMKLDDKALDQILAHASRPEPTAGFEARLFAQIDRQQTGILVPFPQHRLRAPWLMGLPLAASLMLGIWFGASGHVSDYLTLGGDSAAYGTSDFDAPGAVDDLDNINEDSLT